MEKVLLEKKGHVAVITLNDTKVLNALSYNMVMDIKEAFETVKADKDVYARNRQNFSVSQSFHCFRLFKCGYCRLGNLRVFR